MHWLCRKQESVFQRGQFVYDFPAAVSFQNWITQMLKCSKKTATLFHEVGLQFQSSRISMWSPLRCNLFALALTSLATANVVCQGLMFLAPAHSRDWISNPWWKRQLLVFLCLQMHKIGLLGSLSYAVPDS